MNFLENIGERLSEERRRAALSQAAIAEIGGITVKTQVLYEKSERFPDARYLAAIAQHNLDVQYILTAVRSEDALSVEEVAVVNSFRQLDARGRAGVLALLSGIQPAPVQRVRVKGDVGQFIEGDVHLAEPFTINMGKKSKKTKS